METRTKCPIDLIVLSWLGKCLGILVETVRPDSQWRAKWIGWCGLRAMRRRYSSCAQSLFRQALRNVKRGKDCSRLRAFALFRLSELALSVEDYNRAIAYATSARQTASEDSTNCGNVCCDILEVLGDAQRLSGQHAAAITTYLALTNEPSAMGDHYVRMRVFNILGTLYADRSESNQAERYYRLALDEHDLIPRSRRPARNRAAANLAELLEGEGRESEARRYRTQAENAEPAEVDQRK